MKGPKCLNKVDLWQVYDGRIFMGNFSVDQLDGTGFTFIPGSYYLHELFEEGKLVQGIQLSSTG